MNAYKNRVKRLARAYFWWAATTTTLSKRDDPGFIRYIRGLTTQKGSFAAFADLCITTQYANRRKNPKDSNALLNESLSLNTDLDNTEELIDYIIDQTTQDPLDVLLKRTSKLKILKN